MSLSSGLFAVTVNSALAASAAPSDRIVNGIVRDAGHG